MQIQLHMIPTSTQQGKLARKITLYKVSQAKPIPITPTLNKKITASCHLLPHFFPTPQNR